MADEAKYVCRKCGKALDPKRGVKVQQFSGSGGEKLIVRCPGCQTENAFKVPKQ
jgi:RNase P subunit RPR2